MEQKKKGNRWIALAVCLLMLSSLFVPFNVQEANAAESELQNPRQAADGTVTWDCITFGHYPQGAYNPQQEPSDPNQEEVYTDIDAEKTNFVYVENPDHDMGHYYKVEPIKWRVLSVEGDDAFLIADKNIDGGIPYNETGTDVTWETCTFRSWLNGYGSGMNKKGEDYTSDNFVDRAFTSGEQNAIRQTTVVNEDNPEYGTEGGNNTQDKVYLLSIGETKNPEYGFPAHYNYSETRAAFNTAYIVSKGMHTEGSHGWLLRSPGSHTFNASYVYDLGAVDCYGTYVGNSSVGVRPALHLNLSSNLWSYAGTVEIASNALNEPKEVSELNITISDQIYTGKALTPVVTVKDGDRLLNEHADYTTAYSDNINAGTAKVTITGTGEYTGTVTRNFIINKANQTISAKSIYKAYGDSNFALFIETPGRLTYKSSNPEVADVNNQGIVTLKGIGETTITISAEETDNYNKAVKDITLTVAKAASNLKNPRRSEDGTPIWDCVYFGHYPQSSDGKGGFNNDPIKWRVLSVEANEATLLSDKNLDIQPYNEEYTDVIWATCTLNSWLNTTFLNKAFSSDEQKNIVQTLPLHGKVSIPSLIDMMNNLWGFDSSPMTPDMARRAANTAYASSKSATAKKAGEFQSWWLAAGSFSSEAPGVNDDGTLWYTDHVNDNDVGVRPTIDLDLCSDVWSYAGTVSEDEDEQVIDAKQVQTITAANVIKPYGAKPFSLNAKTSGGGKLTYKSSNPAVATVSSTGVVTIKGAGKATITISAAETDRYSAATKNVTITVTKVGQSITGASSFTKTYGDKTFSLGAKAKTKLTYKTSNTKVATVSSAGKVTLKGPGKATITMTAAASGNYNAATKRVTITVKPKKLATPKVKSTRSRTLKVSWKRDTKATGYQVIIAQNSKFKKGKKTATITKNKTTSKTFKKLKRKKTYYAKVRAYKKVGNTKLYGSYSKVKKVRVR